MILINKCFSEVTPESAELGEPSDSGFEWENAECTFKELVQYLREHNIASCMPAGGNTCEWYGTGYNIEDYETMTERETTIHFSRSNPPYKAKYWKLAAQCAGIVK